MMNKIDVIIHKNQWYWGSTLTIIKNDGMASVQLQLDNKYPTVAFVKGLIVHDTCRKKGIGSAMLDACIKETLKCGKLFLQLNAKKDSWIVGWYERKGFTIIYEDDDEYTMWKQLDIKPQSHWKPSNEQIEALEHFVRSIGESGFASPYDDNMRLLYSLLEQLKKL